MQKFIKSRFRLHGVCFASIQLEQHTIVVRHVITVMRSGAFGCLI
jgi:hypothetical protein